MNLHRNCSAWIAVRVFNQTFLRLNFKFVKEHHLLILQNWFISAPIDFLQIHINASLYEWQYRQGPVTIWITIFCHSVKIKNPCYKRIYLSINIPFHIQILHLCKFSKLKERMFHLLRERPGPASSLRLNDWGLPNYAIYSAGVRRTAY